mgnify:CR=1 FL=1
MVAPIECNDKHKDNETQERANLLKSLVSLFSAITLTGKPSLIEGLKDDVRRLLSILEADQCYLFA